VVEIILYSMRSYTLSLPLQCIVTVYPGGSKNSGSGALLVIPLVFGWWQKSYHHCCSLCKIWWLYLKHYQYVQQKCVQLDIRDGVKLLIHSYISVD